MVQLPSGRDSVTCPVLSVCLVTVGSPAAVAVMVLPDATADGATETVTLASS